MPSCNTVSYPVPEMNLTPTMYPSAEPGDLDKRTLSDDDRSGLCAIYPIGTNPVSCGGAKSGCSIAGTSEDGTEGGLPGRPGSSWRWLVVGLAGAAGSFVLSRRRRRQPPRR